MARRPVLPLLLIAGCATAPAPAPIPAPTPAATDSAPEQTLQTSPSAAALQLVLEHGRRVKDVPPLADDQAAAWLVRLEALLGDPDVEARWKASYALSEVALPGRGAALERAATAKDPRTRLFAIRGLAREAAAESFPLLRTALADPDPHVAAAAASGLGKLKDMAAVSGLRNALLRNRSPADHHVRLAAVQAILAMNAPCNAVMAGALRNATEDPSPRVRAAALKALLICDPAVAAETAVRWSASDDVLDRIAAVGIAQGEALAAMVASSDDRVAATALERLIDDKDAAAATKGVHELALKALERTDLAVRDAAVRLVTKQGDDKDLPALEQVFFGASGDANTEVRVTLVRAIAEHYKVAAVDCLRGALDDPTPAVAKAASDALKELTGTDHPPPVRPDRASSVPSYAGPTPVRATLHTSKGDVVLELLPALAPHHVEMFVQFARSGRYDGLTFHRVVTGFVVQGLDPRGDGWGTGGVFLKDELTPTPYAAGTIGMPNAGPDTGGSQLFITHVPTPHLDGRYTVFGRVVEGMDVVHALDLGDTVRKVSITGN